MQKIAKAPCASCPYRQDVPSGVWDASEYKKLPTYDGSIMEQLSKGATKLFGCHQKDGCLCAGWVATHGASDLLAMRLHGESIPPEVWSYESPVPVFASGREAAEHGMREIEAPPVAAKRVIDRLQRKG
jgi:hypothetical protein